MLTRIGPMLATASITATLLTAGVGGGQASADISFMNNCPGHYAYHAIPERGVIAETCRTWEAVGGGYYIGAWEIRHKATNAKKVVVQGNFDNEVKKLEGTSGVYERTINFTIRACGTNQHNKYDCSKWE